jgi:hypothetical protein
MLYDQSWGKTGRRCGECSLCCKLVPIEREDHPEQRWPTAIVALGIRDAVPEFDKPAGQRCKYQRRTGCRIYERRPFSCQIWTCRWLANQDTAELSRPDRSHYVLDISPYEIVVTLAGDETTSVEAVQVWVDPNYPDAHKDPALRAYLDRQKLPGLVRYGNGADADFILSPPSRSNSGQWLEIRANVTKISDSDHAQLLRSLA